MSRGQKTDATHVYRALVTVNHPAMGERKAREYTTAYGPYSIKGAAKTAGRRESAIGTWLRDRGTTSSFKIQRAPLVWEDVEE
jgi:hypothetical protein